jgi:hypothetical protein
LPEAAYEKNNSRWINKGLKKGGLKNSILTIGWISK